MRQIVHKLLQNKLFRNPMIAPFVKPDFIGYCMIGVLGMIVDFSVFYLCYKIIGIEYTWANVISSHCGIFHNFILNSIFTFKTTDKKFIRFLSYYGISLIGIALGTFLLYVFTDLLGIYPTISKLLVLGIITPIQFFSNKYITFRKKTSIKVCEINN